MCHVDSLLAGGLQVQYALEEILDLEILEDAAQAAARGIAEFCESGLYPLSQLDFTSIIGMQQLLMTHRTIYAH